MSVRDFLQAIPKVELNIQFEGALPADTLQSIAEQNDVPRTYKTFKQWLKLYRQPDFARIEELLQVISQWIQQPEDLTRLVYEVGVGLAKQNIRYAEITINPLYFVKDGLTFEQFLNAINDGRSRLERAWHVRLAWILGIARDQIQQADDVLRWASGHPAAKGGAMGLALLGFPDGQPASDFERIFRTAEKKELGRVFYLASGDHVSSVLERLKPDRIVIGSGVDLAIEDIRLLTDHQVAIESCITRDRRNGRLSGAATGVLRRLYEDGIRLSLSSEMPYVYQSSLTEELVRASETQELSVDEIEEVLLNAVQAALLPSDSKQALVAELQRDWQRLKIEHQIPHEVA